MVDGNLDILEVDEDGIGSALPHHVFLLADFDAVGIGGHDKAGDAFVAAARIGGGEEGEVTGVGTTGDPRLGAIDDVVIPLQFGGGTQAGGITARIRLGEAVGSSAMLFGEHAEPLLLLFFGATDLDRYRRQIVDGHADRHAGAAIGEFFGDDRFFHVTEIPTPVGRRRW